MSSDHPLQRVEAESPDRCQAVDGKGQCIYKSVEGGTRCMRHGGNKQTEKIERESKELYQVDMYKARIAKNKTHSETKTLTNEIAILRMLLESKLNKCTTDMELMLASSSIGDLVLKIERVVSSCHKLEKSMGHHLDKSILLQFAGQIVEVISNNVDDKELVKRISDGILDIMIDA